MSYSWDEIKVVIERRENERLKDELSFIEQKEEFVGKYVSVTERTKTYLEFLGELSIGVSIGIFSIIFNFLLFVWLLHIEF